jgi:hypothetical protein
MIIGVCGLAGSGKNAVSDVLIREYKFCAIAFADPMKRFCAEIFDWPAEWLWGKSELRSREDTRYIRRYKDLIPGKIQLVDVGERREITAVPEYLTPRYALQKIGTEWARDCYPDVWVEYAVRIAKKIMSGKGNLYSAEKGLSAESATPPEHNYNGVVITDVRFKNEITGVHDRGGKLIRVKRPGVDKAEWDHPSETEQLTIPDKDFDYVLENDGTIEDLTEKVAIALKEMEIPYHQEKTPTLFDNE